MKKINKILTGALVVLILSACTSDFEEINTNPNRTLVGDIKASAMFEPILYNGAKLWLNYTWFWNDELIQFTAFTGGTTRMEHRYSITEQNWASLWDTYSRYGNNIDHMYSLSMEQEDRSLEAISLTMKVMFMSNLTDMYGDIPYAEAFQGRLLGGTKTPKFDSQKEVYEQMFADLEAANEIYAEDPVFIKPALDGMYGGSMEKWQKFNNSLYLRLLCRVSGRSEMNVGSKIKAILADASTYPIFVSNEDNATVNFSGSDPYLSQFAIANEGDFTSSGRKLTEQLIKMTVVTENDVQVYTDPRLPIIGKKNPSTATNPDNVWKGTVAGCTQEEQSTVDRGTSWLNHKVFCRPDAPGFFMDYAEVQFILAEAALKGWIDGGTAKAKEYYTAAVTASLEKWAEFGQYSETPVVIAEADITTFLDSKLASWDLATNKEELIANQKYLALFWTGMEAYHEYRRTGFPVLTIGAGTNFNDFILPTRFAYPNTTMATNSANAQEALSRMGGENNMKTPVWWSKQAISGSN
jgi:hypothetical protein